MFQQLGLHQGSQKIFSILFPLSVTHRPRLLLQCLVCFLVLWSFLSPLLHMSIVQSNQSPFFFGKIHYSFLWQWLMLLSCHCSWVGIQELCHWKHKKANTVIHILSLSLFHVCMLKVSSCICTMPGIWTLVPSAERMWCVPPKHGREDMGGFGRGTADCSSTASDSHAADTY